MARYSGVKIPPCLISATKMVISTFQTIYTGAQPQLFSPIEDRIVVSEVTQVFRTRVPCKLPVTRGEEEKEISCGSTDLLDDLSTHARTPCENAS